MNMVEANINIISQFYPFGSSSLRENRKISPKETLK